MKREADIPMSAASKNLRIALWVLAIGLVLFVCSAPSWLYTFAFGVSGAFMFSMVMCILDIQEFKMKQSQKMVELLGRIVNRSNDKSQVI